MTDISVPLSPSKLRLKPKENSVSPPIPVLLDWLRLRDPAPQ